MIPTFPTFKPIELADKHELDAFLHRHPPLASEYTFTNLFAWSAVNHYQLARFNDGFLLCKGEEKHLSFQQPLVSEDEVGAVQACLDYLRQYSDTLVIERVGEDFLAHFPPDDDRFIVQEDRDNFDYVYTIDEMVNLPGEKFHDKKNLVNQFCKKYDYRYVPMTPELVEQSLRFQHDWCAERECEKNEGLAHEQCAVYRMLRHFAELKILGGFLEVEGHFVALTLAEPLNPDTLVIHVEKARAGMTGIYQVINQEFLRHAGNGYTYVNREQDLGIEGLRKAKLSYNPVRMVKKYRITIAST